MDIEPDTANIDPNRIEDAITPRTKAILPVEAFGQPAGLDGIREIADRHGLVVIEDSCESLGSEYKGTKAGHGAFSHGAVFAFYPNKQITTGEGGMIVTDDDRLPESEKGTFSKAITSSAKLRVAVLEKRLREARAMLGEFEDKYGKAYPDFERDFPDNADIRTHEDLVEWAFWDRVVRDCFTAIEGYKLLTGQ